jgi:hypothetical protein
MAGWLIEVTGLRSTIDALDRIDKKATKSIRDSINTVAKAVKVNAAGRITETPLSNWGAWTATDRGRDLGFTTAGVASGFKVYRNNFRKRGVSRGYGVDVRQSSPGGSIFEVIGDKSRTTGPRGEQFVDSILAKFGNKMPPRSLLPAYYSAVTPEVQERIRDQIIEEARKAGLV